jgi:hypothetical protein
MSVTILNGGSRTTQDQYTGSEHELTVDASNRNLRLHDGATQGGHVIYSAANSDARYQPKSTELLGLLGFEPHEKGLLVRIGPAEYQLRQLTANSASLTLANANGYAGNPNLSLAETITSEHTWDSQHIFNDVVQFNAGINADVSGDLTGNVTGNLTGNVTGNLTGNANGSHTGSFAGNINVSAHVLTLADDQIPTAKINNLLGFVESNGFPSGGIILWEGLESAIPAGWFLCDGLNGTPDLRGRFLVGAAASGTYDPGDSGGVATHAPNVTVDNAGSHTHALSGSTGSAPAGVNLTLTLSSSANWDTSGGTGEPLTNVTRTDPGHTHTQGGQADANGIHIHTATVDSFDNRPPYYALCYIMKG